MMKKPQTRAQVRAAAGWEESQETSLELCQKSNETWGNHEKAYQDEETRELEQA